MKIIAKIYNNYNEKFGIPRQSGIVKDISVIEFEPEYRIKDAFDKIETYSHLWIIWEFSQTDREKWTPKVRPPKLGGNTRVGVFATRSPFRPNPIGLSCVKLIKIEFNKKRGPLLFVEGADLMNETPIYDIKPYIPYADSIPDASCGLSVSKDIITNVIFPLDILKNFDVDFINTIKEILQQNPIPAYKKDTERIYKMEYANKTICFKCTEKNITVTSII